MLWDWTDIQALAANYRTVVVRLSAESLALFLSSEDLTKIGQWSVSGSKPTSTEANQIEEMTAQAYFELMTNVMLGTIFPLITDSVPEGALECDGTTYNRTDYPDLYAALASVYIVDADHFTTPDLRGRTVIGAGAGAGLSTYATGDTGGEESHVLTTAELAAHSHGVTDPTHTHTEITVTPTVITIGAGAPAPSAVPGVGVTGASATGITVNSEGADSAHENRQPYLALRYAVWAI